MKSSRLILIIAGPNGAGKTSFMRNFLPEHERGLLFLNADLIAAGISPLAPHLANIRAGKIMLALIREYVTKGRSFAFETTLSGRIFARRIPPMASPGFLGEVVLFAPACARNGYRTREVTRFGTGTSCA